MYLDEGPLTIEKEKDSTKARIVYFSYITISH